MSAPLVQEGPRTRHGVATSTGRRPLNEDAVLARPPVFVVADGMGGHDAGEVASALAVAAFAELAGRSDVGVEEITQVLRTSAELVREIATAPGRGAGTTVTGACLSQQDGVPYWIVFNLGDSRTYRLADGLLQQISVDHSEVQELLESGELAPADAEDYARRNVITRALGAGVAVEPDFWLLPVGSHDRLLICSDGMSGDVDDDEIAAILLHEPDPQRAAEALVDRALLAGARDNVTVLVVDALGDVDDETLPRGTSEDTIPTGGLR